MPTLHEVHVTPGSQSEDLGSQSEDLVEQSDDLVANQRHRDKNTGPRLFPVMAERQ